MSRGTQSRFVRVRRWGGAFTLIELLFSMSILAILILMMTQVLSDVQNLLSRSRAQVEEFEDARAGFESMARRISQATLNSYWGYVYTGSGATANPSYYSRLSDMHFVSGPLAQVNPAAQGAGHGVFFQALLGDSDDATTLGPAIAPLGDLLNCWGYYVDYGSDTAFRPPFLAGDAVRNPERKRFRLMEFRLPADESILFSTSLNLSAKTTARDGYQWFRGPFKTGSGLTSSHAVPLADNILALILNPSVVKTATTSGASTTKFQKTTDYVYDSRAFQWGSLTAATGSTKHQLPPLMELTLIAADERSYERLEQRKGVAGAANDVRAAFKGRFTNPADLTKDLADLEKSLGALQLHFKVFSTTVALRASKWVTEKES